MKQIKGVLWILAFAAIIMLVTCGWCVKTHQFEKESTSCFNQYTVAVKMATDCLQNHDEERAEFYMSEALTYKHKSDSLKSLGQ